MILTPLTIAFCLLQLGDAVTTYLFMKNKDDGLTEGNKAMKWLMEKVGVVPALALPKMLVCTAVLFWPLSNIVLIALVFLYLYIVARNVVEMVKVASK